MHKVLKLYNEWSKAKQIAFDLERSAEDAAKKLDTSIYKTVYYQTLTEARTNYYKLEMELYDLLNKQIYELPNGNFLVPYYDDCLDYTVKIMERFTQ